MSNIDQSFVKEYESEVHVAYQRKGSKMRNTVRTENDVQGESTTFQKVGYGSAGQKSRNGVVPVMNLDHTPVECTLEDWFAADWVDKFDQLKIKHNERKVVSDAGAMGLGRKTDELIIAKADAATTYQTTSNLSTLTAAKFTEAVIEGLGDRNVPLDDGEIYGFVSMKVWAKMLTINEFAQHEYVGADQLPYAGKGLFAKRWLGVLWMPHTGLSISSNVRKNLIWHRNSIGHAIGAEIETDVTWHGDRHSFFVNNAMSMGACVIDTIGVQQLLVTENL